MKAICKHCPPETVIWNGRLGFDISPDDTWHRVGDESLTECPNSPTGKHEPS